MKYFKEFLLRGMLFGGFGPIVMAVVYFILHFNIESFSLSGTEAALAIVSTYILAFVHAGASVFNSVESWSIPKSLGIHFSILYAAYVGCYLINRWIPFDISFILVFTSVFVIVYLAIWVTVYLIVKSTQKALNKKL